MNTLTGFTGTRDFKTADSIFFWKADTAPGTPGYATYYLLNATSVRADLLRWVKVGDAQVLPRDEETLLLGNRSVFVRTSSEVPQYTAPSPWSP